MKKIAIICLICFGATTFINAQGYISALGLRYSGNNSGLGSLGVTLQQRVTQNTTLEVIGEYRSKDPILTALFEFHKPIFIKGLNIYVGGGGHTNLARLSEGDVVNNFKYGINGILGAELRLPFFPLVISADIMPEINKVKFKDPVDVNLKDWDLKASTNISVRYVLSSDRMKRKKQKKKKKEAKQELKAEKQEVRKEKRETTIDNIKDKEKRKQWFEKLKDKLPKLGEKEKSSKK